MRRPHRRQPTGLPRPWDSPGKNTGVGCHFLLQCMKARSKSEVAQSCPTICDHQAPPSMGSSRQEYWSGVPLPSPNKYCGGYKDLGTLVHCWWDCKLKQPLLKTLQVTKKLKNRTTIWSSNPTSGYIAEGNEINLSKRYVYFHVCTIYSSQDMKTTSVSINEWTDNKCDIYTQRSIIQS